MIAKMDRSGPVRRDARLAEGQPANLEDFSKSVAETVDGEPPVALVRSAVTLRSNEQKRLRRALEHYVGGPLKIRTKIDPEMLGGIWVRIGDTVIDGSLRGQLDAMRDQLCAECRQLLATGLPPVENESRHE